MCYTSIGNQTQEAAFEWKRIQVLRRYYDTFMDNVPYEEWGGYIHRILCENDINDGILLDLGCGTGTMTELFAGFGYDMIGVDNSADMLEIAMEREGSVRARYPLSPAGYAGVRTVRHGCGRC